MPLVFSQRQRCTKVRTSNGRSPMTITTQHTEFGEIYALGDQHPGTLDVSWAEEALRRSQRTDQPYAVRRLLPRRRPRRGLRRVIAAAAIASCKRNLDRAGQQFTKTPRWTPAPVTTSRPRSPRRRIRRASALRASSNARWVSRWGKTRSTDSLCSRIFPVLACGWVCSGQPRPGRGSGDVR